jgi:hypothetical protein
VDRGLVVMVRFVYIGYGRFFFFWVGFAWMRLNIACLTVFRKRVSDGVFAVFRRQLLNARCLDGDDSVIVYNSLACMSVLSLTPAGPSVQRVREEVDSRKQSSTPGPDSQGCLTVLQDSY